MIAWAVERWNHLWFDENEEFQYGRFRMLFGFGLLLHIVFWMVVPVFASRLPAEFAVPSLASRLLPLPFPPPTVALRVLVVLPLVLALMVCAGLFTRAALLSLGALFLYVGGYLNSWGFFDHRWALPVCVLFILAFAPAVGGYSVDAWLAKRKAQRRGEAPARAPMRTAPWAGRLILALLAMTYFGAGLSKARFGTEWCSGKTLSYYLAGPTGTYFTSRIGTTPDEKWRDGFGLEAFTYDARKQTAIGRAIGRSTMGSRIMSVATLFWEITFPLALLSRRLRAGYLVAGVGFHLGVLITMRLDFMIFVSIYTLFVNWGVVDRWRVRLLRRSPDRIALHEMRA